MNRDPPPSEMMKDVVYLLSESGESIDMSGNRVVATPEQLSPEMKAYIERHWRIALTPISREDNEVYLSAEAFPSP